MILTIGIILLAARWKVVAICQCILIVCIDKRYYYVDDLLGSIVQWGSDVDHCQILTQ